MSDPKTFETLKLFAECPCCEAQQEPHDDECTLSIDDSAAFKGLAFRWEHNVRVDALASHYIHKDKVRELRDAIRHSMVERGLGWIIEDLTALLKEGE